ncbi:MAG: MBL fold metallo-hydrolase [Anaerolineales bacterium]|nr:MBL fold metallo-hydrolase [Anaerolineales bacterium]
MQVEKISETLYKFSLFINDSTVNLGVCIGVDGILLIDTGWAQTAEELNKQVRELDDGIVKLIIITHPHADHIGGRGLLGEEATLIAHKNTSDELAGKYFGLDALPGQELPTITLDNELSLRFNGEDIKIIPAPGHTNSDMAVYFINSGVVFLGDLVLSDTFPPLDLVRGGNTEQYIESIGKLVELLPADVKIITGHGRDYSLVDLREHYQMAVSTAHLIKQGMADGKNAQDMVSEDLLKDWENWSSSQVSSEAWIAQAYESLSDQGKKSISETLTYTIMDKGIEAAIEQYLELKNNQPDSYIFTENELNMLGYQLLWRDMNEAAIEVFKLNVQAYPQSANPYDSLGEAYLASGDEEQAIENYEKAVSIYPNMSSAVDALKKLRPTSED